MVLQSRASPQLQSVEQLMSLSEADAFRWIQKASMDRRVSMKAVAQALLSQYPEG